MEEIKVEIDGRQMRGQPGMTILQAAEQLDIEIPSLCYSPDLRPSGVCRVCVVELEGYRTLVGACHTPIMPGMVIRTNSPKVLAARRAAVELLQAAHDAYCVTDPTCQFCELYKLCCDFQGKRSGFRVRERRSYPIEVISPYVHRVMSKCILCRRCILACSDIAKKNVFAIAYRGYQSKVIVGCDVVIDTDACRDCGICIDYCPTKALIRPREVEVSHD